MDAVMQLGCRQAFGPADLRGRRSDVTLLLGSHSMSLHPALSLTLLLLHIALRRQQPAPGGERRGTLPPAAAAANRRCSVPRHRLPAPLPPGRAARSPTSPSPPAPHQVAALFPPTCFADADLLPAVTAAPSPPSPSPAPLHPPPSPPPVPDSAQGPRVPEPSPTPQPRPPRLPSCQCAGSAAAPRVSPRRQPPPATAAATRGAAAATRRRPRSRRQSRSRRRGAAAGTVAGEPVLVRPGRGFRAHLLSRTAMGTGLSAGLPPAGLPPAGLRGAAVPGRRRSDVRVLKAADAVPLRGPSPRPSLLPGYGTITGARATLPHRVHCQY